MGFGNDGTNNMMGSQTSVATRLHKEVNPFLLACHYVAHHTNLATLNVPKTLDCKVLSIEIDVLIDSISSFFRKLKKCKHTLTTLEK